MSQTTVPTKTHHPLLALPVLASLFIVWIVWGTTYLAIQIALESIPPFIMIGTRFIVSGLILYVFLRWRGIPNPPLDEWKQAIPIGFLMFGVGVGMTAFAVQFVSSGVTAVIVAIIPMMTMLMAMFFGEHPERHHWLGIGLGLVGIILLNLDSEIEAEPIGIVFLLLALSGWSLGSLWKRHRVIAKNRFMFNAAEMIAGGAGILLVGLLRGEQLTTTPTSPALLAWVYMTLFGSLFVYIAYSYLLSHTPLTIATSYAYVNPIIAVFMGVWLANEVFTANAAIALLIILGGVFLMMRQPRKRKEH